MKTRSLGSLWLVSTLVIVLLLAGCHKSLVNCSGARYLPDPPTPPLHSADVLFATDRLLKSPEKLVFSGRRNLELPRLTYGEKCEEPEGGAAVCTQPSELLAKGDFFKRVTAGDRDVVLFIHGYRYSFDEALQISERIVQRSNFNALPVAYSWPSQNHLFSYGMDYDMNEWTFEHLTGFLQDLVNALPKGHVLHIVAHSMGNRAALQCLARLSLPADRLGQLIMIAPDVDAQTFRELFLRSGPFKRRTIYLSNHDLALGVARILHYRTPRAGDAKRGYVVADGLDTVDASPLDAGLIGHSYYETSQWMFEDIGAVLRGESPADRKLDRCEVKSVIYKNAKYQDSAPSVIYRLPYNHSR